MKILFVHQNFPGQYLHILRRYRAQGEHDLLFLTLPNNNAVEGVRKMEYPLVRGGAPGVDAFTTDFEAAMLRAQSVATMARRLGRLGYVPDLVLGHNGWGELLHLREVWPRVPIIPYFEFYYRTEGLDVDFDPEFPLGQTKRSQIRCRNATNLLGLEIATLGQTPTRFQADTYPDWAQPKLRLVPEGVDLDLCRPDPAASFRLGNRSWTRGRGRRLLTFVSRNLEPYRGFHVALRALPRLLDACPDLDVVMVGGDETSYGAPCPDGTWRTHFLREMEGRLDLGRVFFPGKIAYDAYRALLQVSALHLYLTYPFVASWSLREAMAAGCCVLGADVAPVREFLSHGETGWLTPFLDPAAMAEAAIGLLADDALRARLGGAARGWAERHLTLDGQHAAFDAVVEEAMGVPLAGITG